MFSGDGSLDGPEAGLSGDGCLTTTETSQRQRSQ